MKKIGIVMIVVLFALVGCGASSGGKKEVLRVYNWGEYIDSSVISAFESEFNVHVQYDTFTSNEDMYTKLLSGETYDVIVPSDYMTQRMREEGLLLELDYSKIPNYDKVSAKYKGKNMDPENKYTVPYFAGSVGIVYDTTKVSKSDVESQGWEIFRDSKYKGRVYFYDSERDSFMVALKALGYSMNTDNPDELKAAYEWLLSLKGTTDPDYVTDQVLDGMIGGERDIALMYSGDATYVIAENPNLAYYEPQQGTNIWTDAMVIPTVSENPDLAHKFINYIADPENSKTISQYVGYTSPIDSTVEELTAAGGDFEGISSYIPRSGFALDEEFEYNAKTKEILSDYWLKVLAQ